MADSLKVRIDGDDKGLEKTLSGVGKVGKKAGAAIAKGLAVATSALAAGTAAAIKFGSEYEASAAKASTLFGDVAVDVENLDKKMLALSSSTGVAATELNEALYSALSAGIPATEDMGEALGIIENSTKLAKAGFTDIDTALSATAKTLNAYGLGVEETERIQGILIQTQNKGITTVGELGASLAQVTPTAAAFGVSFENVGAALATMTAQGTPTAQATTQLNSLIAELGKNGTVAAKNLEQAAQGTQWAGMSFAEMMNSGASLSDVLSLLNDEAARNGVSMVDMFSSIEAGKAALSVMSQEGATFTNNLSAMSDTAGLVDEAYGKVSNTLEAQSARMAESIKNLGIAIYTENDSIIADMAGFGGDLISQLTDAFNEGGLEGLAESLGSAVSQIAVKLCELAPQFIDAAIQLIQSLISGLIENMPLIFDSALQIVQNLVTGIIVNLPALLEAAIQIIPELANGITSTLPSLIPTIINVILQIVETLLDNLDELLIAAIDIIVALAEGLIDALPELVNKIPIIIQKLVQALLDPAVLMRLTLAAVELVIALAGGIIKSIPALIAAGIEMIVNFIANIKENILQIFDVGKDFVSGLWDGICSSWEWLTTKISEWCGNIFDKIKSFFGIHSPSRLMRDEVGKMLTRGLAVGIDEGKTEVQKVMDEMNEDLLESEEKYNAESERLKDSKSDADKEYLEKLKTIAENERKVYDAMVQDLETTKDKILDAYDEILDAETDFADGLKDDIKLFDETKITIAGAGEHGEDLEFSKFSLSDISSQTDSLKNYSQRLEELKNKADIPQEFFAQFKEMSVEEGSSFLDALLGASDEELQKYISDWEEYRKTTDVLAEQMYSDDYAAMVDQFEEEFGTLPEGFFDIGSESSEQFSAGFIEMIKSKMAEAKQVIESSLADISLNIQVQADSRGGIVNNYSSTYNIQPSGTSTAEQLAATRDAETLNRMRGVE